MQFGPSLNQITVHAKIWSEKEWVKTQFGEEDLYNRISKALENVKSEKQFKFLVYKMYNDKQEGKKLLIQFGLKPIATQKVCPPQKT